MKKYSIYSFIILTFSFFICRYVLFDLHGMKEMPTALFVIALCILVMFSFVNYRKASIFLSLAYPIGFVLGFMLQKMA